MNANVFEKTEASPFFAKPEMGSVRFRVQKIRRRPSHAALRRNARPYAYAGVIALRSSLTLPRFPVLLRSRNPGAATSAGAGPRQRDDPALVGVIDQGASDTASARLSTGLAPAGLALRAWWRLLERRVRGWRPAGVVAILGQACFQLPDALAQMRNECRLLRNPFTQPLKLVVRFFWRMG